MHKGMKIYFSGSRHIRHKMVQAGQGVEASIFTPKKVQVHVPQSDKEQTDIFV